jgi:hypothetical protein
MACPTEPAAKCAAERISAFARRLNERVEALDALADGLSDDEYERRWNKRRTLLQRARWPFGLKRGEYESLDLDVRVGPLLFVQKVT